MFHRLLMAKVSITFWINVPGLCQPKINSVLQGPHGKLVQKENLSHTLKNKVFFLIFLIFHDNNI